MSFPVFKNTERFSVLPDGEYIGYIKDCISGYSKSGNPMWTIKLEFDGGIKVTDYLVLNQTFAWKMKALVDAVGLPYDGNLEAWQLNGLGVRVLLGQQEASGNYPAKNVVQNYLVSDAPVAPMKMEAEGSASIEVGADGKAVDDLPF